MRLGYRDICSRGQRDFVPGRSEFLQEGAVGREVLPDEGERGTDTSIFGNPRQKLDAGFLASGVHVVRKNQRAAFTIRPAPGIQVAPSKSTQTEKIRSIVRIRPWIALLFGEFRQRFPQNNAGEYYAQITGNPVVRKRQLQVTDGVGQWWPARACLTRCAWTETSNLSKSCVRNARPPSQRSLG